jgi:hypothetical protein
MSKINTAIVIAGTVGFLGITAAQTSQVRQLEERLVALESAAGGGATAQVDNSFRRVAATAPAQLGMASAAPGNGIRGMPAAVGISQKAPSGDAEAVIVGSEDQIAQVVAQQTQRMRDERRERWSEIGMEHTRETVHEIADQEGIDSAKVEQVVQLLQVWSDDRRYLHEGLMDGSLSVRQMREEMGSSREQLEQEVETIIGQTAAAALWEEMSSWRGHH